MSANNIYQIDQWQPLTNYSKDYIIQNNGLFYYSAFNQASSSSFATDLSNGQWNGYVWYLGQNYPMFIWKQSYKASNESTPRVKLIQFGDGFAVRQNDGINSLLLNYTLTFENRSLSEITAILHFLSARNGSQSFVWVPPAPRSILSTFVCSKWTDVQEFYSNYTIQATFTQTPV